MVNDRAPGLVEGDGIFYTRGTQPFGRVDLQMPGTAQTKRRPVEFYGGKTTGTKLGEGFVRNVSATQNAIMREDQIS
jgi:hypothetical protein